MFDVMLFKLISEMGALVFEHMMYERRSAYLLGKSQLRIVLRRDFLEMKYLMGQQQQTPHAV